MPPQPKIDYRYAHLIIKKIIDFEDGQTYLDKLESVGIDAIFASFEEPPGDPHIHIYCRVKYLPRWYIAHMHDVFPQHYILKDLHTHESDHRKLISYIFKRKNQDKDESYSSYTANKHNINYITDQYAIFSPEGIIHTSLKPNKAPEPCILNIYKIYLEAQWAPDQRVINPDTPQKQRVPTYTQKLVRHFHRNYKEIYKRHPFTDQNLSEPEMAERTVEEVMYYTNLEYKCINMNQIDKYTFTVLNSLDDLKLSLRHYASAKLKNNYFSYSI